MVVPSETETETETETDGEASDGDVIDGETTRPDTAEPEVTDATDPATGGRRSILKPGFMLNLSPVARRHLLGVAMALSSLVLLSWRLSRPAMWLDESATVVATERTWPDMLNLLRGRDAPLVPFYALLKVLTRATTHFFPHAAGHVEVLFRWPSVAAATLTVWLLTVWLARFCPTPVVLSAGVFLLLSAGFSRYGQEARPYMFVMLFVVICTIFWSRMVREDRTHWRWLWMVLYALSVVLMLCANSLSVTLIGAHLVASIVAPDRGRRLSAAFHTMAAAAMGLAIVEPVVLVMVAFGRGAAKYPALSAKSLNDSLTQLFTVGSHRFLLIGILLPFAFLGLSRVFDAKYQFIGRLAAAWAVTPLVLWVCGIVIKPNLLIPRYMLFTLPAWAILGGLGVVTVAELTGWGLHRLSGSSKVGLAATWAMTAVVLAALVISQWQSLDLPRGVSGHGENIRPALALADAPANRHLPIMFTSRLGAVEISTYGPQDEGRMIGMVAQRDKRYIWPSALPADITRAQLRAAARLILLLRVSSAPNCDAHRIKRSSRDIYPCLPPILQHMNYRVVKFSPGGRGWVFVELYRGGEPPATAAQQTRAGQPLPG